MRVFADMYLADANIAALEKLQGVCDPEGISIMEATMRWFMHHAPLGKDDAVILGASSESQIERSLAACEKDALPEVVVKVLEELKENAKTDVPSI